MAIVFTIGYVAVTHRRESARLALEVLADMNAVKAKIKEAIKSSPKKKKQIESVLSGDLKNIEKKMQKIEKNSAEEKEEVVPVSLGEREPAYTKPPADLLANAIVDRIIEQYLKGERLPLKLAQDFLFSKKNESRKTDKHAGIPNLSLTNSITKSDTVENNNTQRRKRNRETPLEKSTAVLMPVYHQSESVLNQQRKTEVLPQIEMIPAQIREGVLNMAQIPVQISMQAPVAPITITPAKMVNTGKSKDYNHYNNSTHSTQSVHSKGVKNTKNTLPAAAVPQSAEKEEPKSVAENTKTLEKLAPKIKQITEKDTLYGEEAEDQAEQANQTEQTGKIHE